MVDRCILHRHCFFEREKLPGCVELREKTERSAFSLDRMRQRSLDVKYLRVHQTRPPSVLLPAGLLLCLLSFKYTHGTVNYQSTAWNRPLPCRCECCVSFSFVLSVTLPLPPPPFSAVQCYDEPEEHGPFSARRNSVHKSLLGQCGFTHAISTLRTISTPRTENSLSTHNQPEQKCQTAAGYADGSRRVVWFTLARTWSGTGGTLTQASSYPLTRRRKDTTQRGSLDSRSGMSGLP